MEPSDEVEPAAEAKNAKQSEMEKIRKRRDAKVKIMQDEIYGKERFQDIDVVDQTLEQKGAHEPIRLLKVKKEDEQKEIERREEVKKGKKKPTTNEDIQVDVKELQAQETDDKKSISSLEMKKGMGDEFLIEKVRPLIGLFRDDKRRIDLIMVMEDDHRPTVQAIKTDFLTNVVKTGLDLEYEAGVMKKHKHLVFIKVHANDKVLEDYADLLGVKKYFKDKHLDLVKANKFFLFCLFQFRHESEWIKMVRRQYTEPLKYSNLERSYIVYMMLRHLRFGEPNNFYCLTRLLKNKIIVDAYALHDGPYFAVPKQDFKQLNARQILFYNWAGFENIFTFQPINLIYEYFGPKIGFYFAFYEFYNKALIVPVVLGTLVFLYQLEMFHTYRPTKEIPGREHYPSKKLFYRLRESDFPCGHYGKDVKGGFDKFHICPKCQNFSMCPFVKLEDYCDSVYYKSFLDNHTAIYFSFIMSVLVILFVRFWKRAENYLIWMWELGLPPKRSTIRSEYRVQYWYPSRSKYTGLWLNRNGPIINTLCHLVSKIMVWLCTLGAVAFTGGLLWLNIFLVKEYNEKLETKKVYPEYIILSVVAIVGGAAAFVCERICWYISYCATIMENHRIHEDFERSYILKIFSCSFAFTFPMLIYIALIKGTLYFTPIYNYSPNINITVSNKTIASYKHDWLGDLFIRNCGYYASCWDEVVLYYTLTMIFKVLATRIPGYIWFLTTDYNQGRSFNRKIPSWEREYMLETITEQKIVLKINDLIIQIALIALFGFTNSWTMLLAFIMNIWDMRNDARVFLLSCRRPLLYRYVGLGIWTHVLYFICYASTVTMALMLVKSSSLFEKYVFDTLKKTIRFEKVGAERIGWIVYTRLTRFETKNYNLVAAAKKSLTEYKKKVPDVCYFGGMFELQEKVMAVPWPFTAINVTYPGDLVYNSFNYKAKVFRGILFLGYVYAAVAIFLLVHYYFQAKDEKTKENMHKERNLLRVHLQNMKVDKKHPVDSVVP